MADVLERCVFEEDEEEAAAAAEAQRSGAPSGAADEGAAQAPDQELPSGGGGVPGPHECRFRREAADLARQVLHNMAVATAGAS